MELFAASCLTTVAAHFVRDVLVHIITFLYMGVKCVYTFMCDMRCNAFRPLNEGFAYKRVPR